MAQTVEMNMQWRRVLRLGIEMAISTAVVTLSPWQNILCSFMFWRTHSLFVKNRLLSWKDMLAWPLPRVLLLKKFYSWKEQVVLSLGPERASAA